MYKRTYNKRFIKQLKDFPQKEQLKIINKISAILNDPRKNSIKLINTNPPVYRLRVGNYRVFFELDNVLKIMKITDVKRRTTQTYR